MRTVSELGKLLIISPHLGDAVFACGELMACKREAIVTTLLAGLPASTLPLTSWDAAAGFSNSREAMQSRRDEDRRAMDLLHATPVWLDFTEGQYHDPPTTIDLGEAIATQVETLQPNTVMLPAGLFHADNVIAHQAGLLARSHYPNCAWYLYEDMMYRRMTRLLQERLTSLAHFGIDATPVAFNTHSQAELKRHAVQCYASQLHALAMPGGPGHGDIFAPEGFWLLSDDTSGV